MQINTVVNMGDNLKFRKWDKQSKTMIKVEVLDLGQTYKDNPVIMQATGLKDVAGKEIYEGDILCTPTRNHAITFGTPKWVDKFLEVKYSSQYSGFIVLPSKEYLSECLYAGYGKDDFYHAYAEIVGNIYQNQELVNMIEKENE